MTNNLNRRLFNVSEYYQLANAGILNETDRVELINGEIITMSPINSPHGGMVNRLNRLLLSLPEDQVIVTVQNPISLGDYSEPEPDLVVAKFDEHFYEKKHPEAADILLLIEVADSTLGKDQSVKCPLYAKAGIEEYWIIDLVNKKIEVYRDPSGNEYTFKEVFSRKDQVLAAKKIDLRIKYQEIFVDK